MVDPTNDKRIYVAVTGTLYKPGGTRGLYRSDDGGDTWARILAGDNPTTGVADIAIDPSDPDHLFATTWDCLREPDRRTYTGVGSGLYESRDAGATWARAGGPLFGPNPSIGRIGVTFAESDPRPVYVIVQGAAGAFGGFFTSRDGGATFVPGAGAELLTGAFTYGWWFGRVWADPQDADRVFVAGVGLALSEDGGLTWKAAGRPAGRSSATPSFPRRG